MPLFLIAIVYLVIATASNAAIMLYSYAGPSLLFAVSGVLVRFFEFGIIYAIAKRHTNDTHHLFFKAYWIILVAVSVINFTVQGNINYMLNLLNQLCILVLLVLLFLAPVQTKLIKIYASFKIVSVGYAASLFINALTNMPGDASAIIIILLLNFIADVLLVAVTWWSNKQTSQVPA